MDFKDRVRPANWGSPLPFLQMEEKEYRELLRQDGFSEHYIDNELKELARHGNGTAYRGRPSQRRRTMPAVPLTGWRNGGGKEEATRRLMHS